MNQWITELNVHGFLCELQSKPRKFLRLVKCANEVRLGAIQETNRNTHGDDTLPEHAVLRVRYNDRQWDVIMVRTGAQMPERQDNLRYAANVTRIGIQRMRQQPGYYMSRAIRHRNGFCQSSANDSAGGVLS